MQKADESYDPVDPWEHVQCADCGTTIRHPGDAGCDTCEVVCETISDARDEALRASARRGGDACR